MRGENVFLQDAESYSFLLSLTCTFPSYIEINNFWGSFLRPGAGQRNLVLKRHLEILAVFKCFKKIFDVGKVDEFDPAK